MKFKIQHFGNKHSDHHIVIVEERRDMPKLSKFDNTDHIIPIFENLIGCVGA